VAKVAHEGNPVYDNIRIVEGDILSEATLEVTVDGGVSTLPPETPITPPVPLGGCACDLGLPDTIAGCPTAGWCLSSPDDKDSELVICRSGFGGGTSEPYGFCVVRLCCPTHVSSSSSGEIYGTFGTEDDKHCNTPESMAHYYGGSNGARTGIIHLKRGSTRNVATAWGLIIDEQDDTVKLVKWVNQSLGNLGAATVAVPIEGGTVVTSVANPGPGWYYFGSWLYTGGEYQYCLYGATDLQDPGATVITSDFTLLFEVSDNTGFTEADLDITGGLLIGFCAIGGGDDAFLSSNATWGNLHGYCGNCYTSVEPPTALDQTCESLCG